MMQMLKIKLSSEEGKYYGIGIDTIYRRIRLVVHKAIGLRLQRSIQFIETFQVASDMRWHMEKRVHDDNIARHPADTEVWKHLDKIDPPFARDPPYGMLSGWSVKGYNACPTCMDETSSHYLKWGRKLPFDKDEETHDSNLLMSLKFPNGLASNISRFPPLIFGLKISATNKQNRACNEVPPTVGTKSVARRFHEKRKRGKEVTAIGGYKIAHYSKKKKAMINDKANKIWIDLQNEEASSSCTPTEIFMEKLGHIPGHIRGRSASTKHVFETESLRMDLNSEKEKSKQLEKDHLELKENHLKLQKEHVSLTKKVDYLLKHFTAWQSPEHIFLPCYPKEMASSSLNRVVVVLVNKVQEVIVDVAVASAATASFFFFSPLYFYPGGSCLLWFLRPTRLRRGSVSSGSPLDFFFFLSSSSLNFFSFFASARIMITKIMKIMMKLKMMACRSLDEAQDDGL
ncbi:Myb domain protein 62 [Tanacetum coccineum]